MINISITIVFVFVFVIVADNNNGRRCLVAHSCRYGGDFIGDVAVGNGCHCQVIIKL